MKLARKIVREFMLKDASFWAAIPSSSEPAKHYLVIKRGDSTWECSCIAGSLGRVCKHIKLMLKYTGEDRKCFNCGKTAWAAANQIDRHHVERRSTHPEKIKDPENLMDLCRKCHDRATIDPEFEEQLKIIWRRRFNLKQP